MTADCFEALLAALYLDQGLQSCRIFYAKCLFRKEPELETNWLQPKLHITQQGKTDRALIEQSETLQKLTELEKVIDYQFKHIRLLAQAFTHSSISSMDFLKLDTNQNLEFVGDSILQFLTSRYLFLSFPYFQEGQLTVIAIYFLFISNSLSSSYFEVL